MTSDDAVTRQLEDEFGRSWSIGRTYWDREKTQPVSWMAGRRRQLSNRELCKGLSMTVIEDTAADLREALEKEAERERIFSTNDLGSS